MAGVGYSKRLIARLRRFQNSLPYLVILSVASSVALSAYVLAVGNFLLKRQPTDDLGAISLYAADRLSHVYVESEAFGQVGICDVSGESLNSAAAPKSISSLGKIYGKLRLIALINQRLKNQTISAFLSRDFLQIRQIESTLKTNLTNAIAKPSTDNHSRAPFGFPDFLLAQQFINPNNKENLYQVIYRQLERASRHSSSKLVDLNISLGFLHWQVAKNNIRAPMSPNNPFEQTMVDAEGFYKAGVPISVPGFKPILLTNNLDQPQLFPPEDFVSDDRISAPSAMLIEAIYEIHDESNRLPTKKTRSICVAMGNPVLPNDRSAFLLTFPQGIPSAIDSACQLLKCSWKHQGIWQRAAGDIPGNGSLTTNTMPLLQNMDSGQAFAVVLYHWLKTLPTYADPDRCVSLLSAHWQYPEHWQKSLAFDSENAPMINTYLATDNQEPTENFINHSGRGEIGQAALVTAFNTGTGFNTEHIPTKIICDNAPSSSLPLCLDAQGNVTSVGSKILDSDLIQRFFQSIHESNMVAITTLNNAREVKAGIKQARLSHTDKLARSNRDLAATEDLANLAIANASEYIRATYQITANSFRMCTNGVTTMDVAGHPFLISSRWLFYPQSEALSKSDLVNSNASGSKSNWLKSKALVLIDTQNQKESGRLEAPEFKSKLKAASSNNVQNKYTMVPTVVVLDSQMVFNLAEPRVLVFRSPAFSKRVIPDGQWAYYCQDAVNIGSSTWSVVIRDLAASYLKGNSATPLPPTRDDWCQLNDEVGTCPGLLAEFQLRSPLPILNHLPSNWAITNQRDQSVMQIPPRPGNNL